VPPLFEEHASPPLVDDDHVPPSSMRTPPRGTGACVCVALRTRESGAALLAVLVPMTLDAWAAVQRRKRLRIVMGISGWEIAHAAVSRRPPISLVTVVARTRMCTHDAKGWGSFHRSRTLFCRPVPHPSVTIRNFCVACMRLKCAGRTGGGVRLSLLFSLILSYFSLAGTLERHSHQHSKAERRERRRRDRGPLSDLSGSADTQQPVPPPAEGAFSWLPDMCSLMATPEHMRTPRATPRGNPLYEHRSSSNGGCLNCL
jgi:hypothetical protein